jgi:hypothetical protein
MKKKAPFKLIYNNDTTNTCTVVSPWHEDGEPFKESMLVASIDEVANTGVDAYMLSPGMGWVPWWQSEVEPDFYEWWEERTGIKLEAMSGLGGYETYVKNGGDMVQVLVDSCKKHGMAPFVSLRINDVHHQEQYVLKNLRSIVSCRFYVEHPEWHIEPEHTSKEGYYPVRGMNWAVPEVRAYKLALLTELAEKYDLAGLELDFLRDNHLFRDGEIDNATRIDIVTDFIKKVRAAIDRNCPDGKRRHLCVRIPLELKSHPEIGLDVKRLSEAGVDMFNLSGWYHTTQTTDVASVRTLVPDAAIYLEMTHSTARYPYFLNSGLYGTNGNPRTSDHQFYTTALLANKSGADGVSLFNFVYYRMGHKEDLPVMEPPFHVLSKLNDTEFLSRQSQYYMLAGTIYKKQLPKELIAGEPVNFNLEMFPTKRKEASSKQAIINAPCRLRLHTKQELAPKHIITLKFNGKLLELTPDTSRFFGNPFDSMISPQNHRRAWILPEEFINIGQNDIEVEIENRDKINVIYLDIGIPQNI